MAKEGVSAGVKGTPSFYSNGKKLGRGQLLPVLDAVYDFLH
jgi:protein-disulfide isomerase